MKPWEIQDFTLDELNAMKAVINKLAEGGQ